MTDKFVSVLLVLSLAVTAVLCQTFQYSRGWTNGKRSEFPSTAEAPNLENGHFTGDEFRTLRMLLHGSAEQPLLINSDFVDKLRKLVQRGNYVPQLRQEKGQNDDNY